MPLNPQTANFPPLTPGEQSWSLDMRRFGAAINPVAAVAAGLYLGIPLAAGQPTTGLTPTLTDGFLSFEDQVIGPFGSLLISAAPKNAVSSLYYGLSGMYYGSAPAKASDVLVGVVSTDNEATAAIRHVAQLRRTMAGYLAVRGLVSLPKCAKGADVDLLTVTKPAGYRTMRIVKATANVLAGVTAGNTTGDDFLFKVGSTTLVTVTAAATANVGVTVGTEAAAHFVTTDSLTFKYNQTDTSTEIVGGLVEVTALIDLY